MTSVKDDILHRIDADERAWNDLVAQVPPARLDEPGPMGEWSFRDLVSHLLSWRNRTLNRLEAARLGEPRPPAPWPDGMEDFDTINDWFRDQHTGHPAEELLRAYDATFATFAAAVDALPAEAFIAEADGKPGYFRWRDNDGELESDFSGHLVEHSGDVRTWLAGDVRT